MKKLFVLLCAALFLFTTVASVAQAAPSDFAKEQSKVKVVKYFEKDQKNQKKNFKIKDVKGHWAEYFILKMNIKGFIKGYEDGTFKPSNTISKLEAIVMLVRSLGWEDEASKAEISAPVKQAKKIPSWAAGHVQIAFEKGILTEGELKSFRPNQGVKRIEVAAMIVRALKLDQENKDEIAIKFLDNQDIPKDLYDVVVLMVATGIMQGTPENLFRPNKPVTRAEMAVLIDRIDGKGDNTLEEISGFISAVGDDSITIKKFGWTKELKFSEHVTVYLDNKGANIEDLKEGYRAKLTLNENNEVTFISAISTIEEKTSMKGKITEIVLGTKPELTIESNGKQYTFKVSNNTDIEINEKEVFLSQLEIGWEATVYSKANLAVEIIVELKEE
ncbi:MAG: S-layer homology domain-containing protein [Bacillota bacterium]